ncbi:hypothetical protein E2C01_091893 [Portunus trituberculatus]|uniref:Uncharacterized protein n=1 Tax=Portunus trituberculatus TaxID=210409 RepID=A0A5B7JWD7_PORTR|nr:hypothetical protein [Portunus trituberculatus]
MLSGFCLAVSVRHTPTQKRPDHCLPLLTPLLLPCPCPPPAMPLLCPWPSQHVLCPVPRPRLLSTPLCPPPPPPVVLSRSFQSPTERGFLNISVITRHSSIPYAALCVRRKNNMVNSEF